MRYSKALIKLSEARDHADKIRHQVDMALTPSAPGGIEGWDKTVDNCIMEAYEASQLLADVLSEVAVDIQESRRVAEATAAQEESAA